MLPLLLTFASALADTGADSPPTADAGVGLVAFLDDVVVLNGTASRDPEGLELEYAWEQTGGPEVDLKGADSPKPEFTVDAPGTLRFALVVSDGVFESEPDSVEVVVPQREFGGGAGCATGRGGGWAGVLAAVGGLAASRRRR